MIPTKDRRVSSNIIRISTYSMSFFVFIVEQKGLKITHYVAGITYGGFCEIKFTNVRIFFKLSNLGFPSLGTQVLSGKIHFCKTQSDLDFIIYYLIKSCMSVDPGV